MIPMFPQQNSRSFSVIEDLPVQAQIVKNQELLSFYKNFFGVTQGRIITAMQFEGEQFYWTDKERNVGQVVFVYGVRQKRAGSLQEGLLFVDNASIVYLLRNQEPGTKPMSYSKLQRLAQRRNNVLRTPLNFTSEMVQQKRRQQRTKIINKRRNQYRASIIQMEDQNRLPADDLINKTLQAYKNYYNQHKVGVMKITEPQLLQLLQSNWALSQLIKALNNSFQYFKRMDFLGFSQENRAQKIIIWHSSLTNMGNLSPDTLSVISILVGQPLKQLQDYRTALYQLYLNYQGYLNSSMNIDLPQVRVQWLSYLIAENQSKFSPVVAAQQSSFLVQPLYIKTKTLVRVTYQGQNQYDYKSYMYRVQKYYENLELNPEYRILFQPFSDYMERTSQKQLIKIPTFPLKGTHPRYQFTSMVQRIPQEIIISFNQPTTPQELQGLLVQLDRLRQQMLYTHTFMQVLLANVQEQIGQHLAIKPNAGLKRNNARIIKQWRQLLRSYRLQTLSGGFYIHGILTYQFQQDVPGQFEDGSFSRSHSFFVSQIYQDQSYQINKQLLVDFLNAQKNQLYGNNYSGTTMFFRIDSLRIYNRYRSKLLQFIRQTTYDTNMLLSGLLQNLLLFFRTIACPGYANYLAYQSSDGYYGWGDSQQQDFQGMQQRNCMIKAYKQMIQLAQQRPLQIQMKAIMKGQLKEVWRKRDWSYRTPGCKIMSHSGQVLKQKVLVLYPNHCYIQKKKYQWRRQCPLYSLNKPSRVGQQIQYGIKNNSIALDIQCLANQQTLQICYLLCIQGKLDGARISKHWVAKRIGDYGRTSPVEQFCQWLCQYISQRKQRKIPLTIWTFNGAKYQNRYLIQSLVKRLGTIKSMGSASNSKGLVLFDGEVKILDARLLVGGGSLSQNAKIYNNLNHQKMQLPFPLPQTFEQWDNNKETIIQYCYTDCVATINLVWNFYQNLWKTIVLVKQGQPKSQKFQYYSCFTASQIGMAILRRQYSGENMLKTQTTTLSYQKESYFGGMVQCFRVLVNVPMYSIDINSAYPHSMTQPLPFRRISQFTPLDEMTKKYWKLKLLSEDPKIIADVQLHLFKVSSFEFNYSSCCFIPVRSKFGLVYPRSYYKQCYVWGHTLQYLLKNGGVVQIQGIIRYDDKDQNGSQCLFIRNYILDVYGLRKLQKQKLQKFMKENQGRKDPQIQIICNMLKLWLNSTYGKFGQRFFNQTQITQLESIDARVLKATIEQGFNVFQYSSNKTSGPGNFIKLASFITSRTRLKLATKIDQLGLDNVVYCDTDSITTIGVPPNQPPNIQLGEFKVEKKYKQAAFFAPKLGFLKTQKDTTQWSIVKSKGINFKQRADTKKIVDFCVEQMKNYIWLGKLGYNQPLHLATIPGCRRWLWDKESRKGNVIQVFKKKINFIQRKNYNYQQERLTPPQWHQL